MEVKDIPVPTLAAIRVSKEGKEAVFETTVVQTTDNKYIYLMPVRVDGKPVNFETKGLFKEIKIEFAPFEIYEWRNISIIKFIEDGKKFLRVKTTTPGIKSMAWSQPPITTQKKKRNTQPQKPVEETAQEQTAPEPTAS
jgi:hypothetical protein